MINLLHTFQNFLTKKINFLSQLFEGQIFKDWKDLKLEFNLTDDMYFQWLQLKHAIPLNWKSIISSNLLDVNNLLIQDHHLIKGSRVLSLDKLTSKEKYSLLVSKDRSKPSSNIYFEKMFPGIDLKWDDIYILPRRTTIETYLRFFQYKMLNNVLFLSKKLFTFGLSNTPQCSFCNTNEETSIHIFSECNFVIALWEQLQRFFEPDLTLPKLIPQTAMFGFLDQCNNIYLINHILLIFKLYVYKSRTSQKLNFSDLLRSIKKFKRTKKLLFSNNGNKKEKFEKKYGA